MRLDQDWIRAPLRVVGYHGCALEVGAAIAAGSTPLLSDNRYDWLGRGLYFWEYGPQRAADWALRRFPTNAAMLEAEIDLGSCLNLLDAEHFDALASVFDTVRQDRTSAGDLLPENTERGRHELDRMIVELYCTLAAGLEDPFQTVRGAFPEGRPVFPGSKILSRTHVQLAVRDLTCVSNWRLIQLNSREPR